MASTRPFTYNTGPRIEGNNQIGNLAYGARGPVNDGPDYSNNPGNKKWWMGPDEDDRYVIVKDVPTMDWPTQTPEGNIGSIRFWISGDTDGAFRSMANNLPARSGQTPFATSREAYDWLINNGYYTNFDYDANEDFYYIVYNTPDSSADSNIGRVALSYRGIAYDSNNNRLLAAPTQNNDSNPQYGNFFIDNFSNTLTSTSSSLWYSGSTWANNYLTNSIDNTTGINNGDTIGQGNMAIDNTNEVLYVCSTNAGAGGARGLIKYDLSDDSVLWSGPDNYSVPSAGKVFLDNSGDYVWLCGAVTAAWICRTGNGKFINFVKEENKTTNFSKAFSSITPGPSNKALGILSGLDEDPIYYIISGSSLTAEPPYIHYSASVECNNSAQMGKPIYLSSTNKWYIPHPGIDSDKRYNKITVVDGNTFQITNVIKFGYSAQANTVAGDIELFIHDSDRGYFWSNTADQYEGQIRYLVAIDVDDEAQVLVSRTTYTNGNGTTDGIYLSDHLVFVGEATIGGGDRGIIQKIDVSDLV